MTDVLKYDNGFWNSELVRQVFSAKEAKAILSLPAGGVRSTSGIGRLGSFLDSISFFEFVLYCKARMSVAVFELLCVVWWRIWVRRNQLVHSDTIVPKSIFDWDVNFLDQFRSVNKREGCGLAKLSNAYCWKALITGSFKINTDAALNIGSKNFEALYQPIIVEAMAILAGLPLALDTGLVPASMDSDALANPCFSSINFVSRLANKVVHGLAKLALDYKGKFVWLKTISSLWRVQSLAIVRFLVLLPCSQGMTDTDISKLCENLSLVDEDEAVLEMDEEVQVDGVGDVDRCLVGKVFSGKKVNREEDRNRVWNRGPWHFGNSLIVMEKPLGSGNIAQLGFNKTELWVHIHDIHDLPILCMNMRTAKWLAEQLGEVVEPPTESRECWGKFMRVKVRIDISKALKRWLKRNWVKQRKSRWGVIDRKETVYSGGGIEQSKGEEDGKPSYYSGYRVINPE
ncbi:hypothetical protein EZV62_014699 [Acer yangbiense]|uniref:Uncharacterized protein n=1 Tax=Acer yangbiense TaxID=1000413 RepID=A0A5C7HV29_9ROSI|nr:hypothetical protein EZV62_014699 [Acer yangbiense]